MPIDPAVLAIYVPLVALMAVTPGSDMLFVFSHSLASGWRAGFAVAAGVCAGLYVYAAAVGLGLAGLFDYSPTAFAVVKWLGVAYLVWLAVQAFVRAPATLEPEGVRRNGRRSWLGYFLLGVLNDLANPKAVVFFVAFFPQFIDPNRGDVLTQAMLLNTIGNAFNIVVLLAVSFSGARMAAWMRARPVVARMQQWLVGTLFLGLAIRLALTERAR